MAMKRFLLAVLLLLSTQLLPAQQYDVAAYLYPAYAAGDPRLRPFWPMGMGEWETVLTMQQRYPRHAWNRHPLWGYINEADPAVMEMEIDQAVSHGVNVFIFDWYWFDGRPWMETTLTEGFLKARNRDKMQFYLMWANHNVGNDWDTRISHLWEQNTIYRGGVDREEFEKICKRNIELFFKQPNYYKIDGKPVFMIYEVSTFIEGFGGVEAAKDALAWFREEVKKAGFPDLELQFTMWDSQFNYSGVDEAKMKNGRPRDEFIRKLGFDSMSHYQFCHYIWMGVHDPVLSACVHRLGQQPPFRGERRGEGEYAGAFRGSPAQGQGLAGRPSQDAQTHYHQLLERMDGNQLPAAGRRVWLRLPGCREACFRGTMTEAAGWTGFISDRRYKRSIL